MQHATVHLRAKPHLESARQGGQALTLNCKLQSGSNKRQTGQPDQQGCSGLQVLTPLGEGNFLQLHLAVRLSFRGVPGEGSAFPFPHQQYLRSLHLHKDNAFRAKNHKYTSHRELRLSGPSAGCMHHCAGHATLNFLGKISTNSLYL